ncbi:MAG TPA: hypothetical protein VMT62_00755 [Syntrophorhabdaceae bacterium]|nr:hypothetical protein [Syntrophorhabdaceae bacterium]
MKKFLLVFTTVAFVLAFAGQSHAAFGTYDLIRVVYDTSTTKYEAATSLYNASSDQQFAGTSNLTVGGGSDAFTGYTGTDWSTLYVAYFLYDGSNTDKRVWVSGTQAESSVARKYAGYFSNVQSILTTYTSAANGNSTVYIPQSSANGYVSRFDASPGTFGGFLSTGTGEASLSTMATLGYVDMNLYYFASGDNAGAGTKIATLRTMADGSTIINPTATPVPPGLLLLAPGLLGLIGLKRRVA